MVTWATRATPSGRYSSQVFLYNGKIKEIGGYGGTGGYTAEYTYDPKANTWTNTGYTNRNTYEGSSDPVVWGDYVWLTTASIQYQSHRHQIGTNGAGYLTRQNPSPYYVYQGWMFSVPDQTSPSVGPAHHWGGGHYGRIYTLRVDTAAGPNDIGSTRQGPVNAVGTYFHADNRWVGATTYEGVHYICGGYSPDGYNQPNLTVYNPHARTFSALASMPAPLRYPRLVGAGPWLFALGGLDETNNYNHKVYRYDIAANTWDHPFDLPVTTFQYPNAVGLDGVLHVWGGSGHYSTDIIKNLEATLVGSAEFLSYKSLASDVSAEAVVASRGQVRWDTAQATLTPRAIIIAPRTTAFVGDPDFVPLDQTARITAGSSISVTPFPTETVALQATASLTAGATVPEVAAKAKLTAGAIMGPQSLGRVAPAVVDIGHHGRITLHDAEGNATFIGEGHVEVQSTHEGVAHVGGAHLYEDSIPHDGDLTVAAPGAQVPESQASVAGGTYVVGLLPGTNVVVAQTAAIGLSATDLPGVPAAEADSASSGNERVDVDVAGTAAAEMDVANVGAVVTV